MTIFWVRFNTGKNRDCLVACDLPVSYRRQHPSLTHILYPVPTFQYIFLDIKEIWCYGIFKINTESDTKHVVVFAPANRQRIKEDGAQRENFLPKYYEQSYVAFILPVLGMHYILIKHSADVEKSGGALIVILIFLLDCFIVLFKRKVERN